MRSSRWFFSATVVVSLLSIAVGAGAAPAFNQNLPGPVKPFHKQAAPTGPLDWQLDSAPTPFTWHRFDAAYFDDSSGQVYAKKVYFLGGQNSDGSIDGSIWWFDPATNPQVYGRPSGNPMLPVPVANYTIAVLQDADGDTGLYVFGGQTSGNTATNAVQVYYPATNTPTTISTDLWPGTANGSVTVPGDVVVVDNKAYALGGLTLDALGNVTGVSAQTWIYDPLADAGSRWTAGPDLNVAKGYIAGATANGLVYAIGGENWDGTMLVALDDVEMLDPADLTAWTTIDPLPMPSNGVAGCGEMRAWGFSETSATHMANMLEVAGCGQWIMGDDGPIPVTLNDGFVYDMNLETPQWISVFPQAESRTRYAAEGIPLMYGLRGQATHIWAWGGWQSTATGPLYLQDAEYRNLTTSPTAVTLTGFSPSTRSASLWLFGLLAGLGLLTLSVVTVLHLRRRTL